jgi:hypothetical protein
VAGLAISELVPLALLALGGVFALCAVLGFIGNRHSDGEFAASAGVLTLSASRGALFATLAITCLLLSWGTHRWSAADIQRPLAGETSVVEPVQVVEPIEAAEAIPPPATTPASNSNEMPATDDPPRDEISTPPSVAPSSTVTRDGALAHDFVMSYLAAMQRPDVTADDLDQWFAFPVRFYAQPEVWDESWLLERVRPNTSPDRTIYDPPVFVDFVSSSPDSSKLTVLVTFTRGNGERGAVDVHYLLEHSDNGQPFRIKEVFES